MTIVIPTRNRARLLDRAVQSVHAQTFSGWLLVVVDDGSTDGTKDLVTRWEDPRVRYLQRREPGGPAAARNDGIRAAQTPFVAFLDDDDEYLPDFLSCSIEHLAADNPPADWSWCGVIHVDDTGRASPRRDLWLPDVGSPHELKREFLGYRRIGAGHGLIVRRHCFAEIGYFDERFRSAEDTDLLVRLASRYRPVVVQDFLVRVHHHAGARLRVDAAEGARTYVSLLNTHREILSSDRRLSRDLHYKTGWLHYHAGNRKGGRRYLLRALRQQPHFLKGWIVFLLFELLGVQAGRRIHKRLSGSSLPSGVDSEAPIATVASGARTTERILAHSPVAFPFRWRARRRLVVLAYHRIVNQTGFDCQMAHLRKQWHPIALDDLLDHLDGRHALPPRSVLVTFDDGDPSIVKRGLPVLEAHGIPSVVFPVAGLVGTETLFWWDEVAQRMARGARIEGLPETPEAAVAALKKVSDVRRRQLLEEMKTADDRRELTARQLGPSDLVGMQSAGVEIGNHTFDHPCLDRCTDGEVREQVVAAHDRLSEILGEAPRVFAYPNGNYDSRAASVLQELGYGGAFLFDHRLSNVPPPQPMAISRIRVNSAASLGRFRLLVSGLHPFLHHALGRP